jgi:hypothetical protein
MRNFLLCCVLLDCTACNRFAFMPAAHLPRDVPEKAEDCPFQQTVHGFPSC